MARSTYFVQECPTCGRSLRIRVEYLGRNVVCQHCQRRFEARDPANTSDHSLPIGGSDLLRRADQLLASIDRPRPRDFA